MPACGQQHVHLPTAAAEPRTTHSSPEPLQHPAACSTCTSPLQASTLRPAAYALPLACCSLRRRWACAWLALRGVGWGPSRPAALRASAASQRPAARWMGRDAGLLPHARSTHAMGVCWGGPARSTCSGCCRGAVIHWSVVPAAAAWLGHACCALLSSRPARAGPAHLGDPCLPGSRHELRRSAGSHAQPPAVQCRPR